MARALRLEVTKGDATGKKFLVPEAGKVFGRTEDVDITLPPKLVSREHCRIEWRRDRWMVEDLGSKNGTYVNGEKVLRKDLHPGDEVKVGANRLKVIGEEEARGEPAKDDKPKPEAGVVALCDAEVLDALSATLRDIIRKVPEGCAFDSNFLIAELMRLNSDAYLRFAAEYAKAKATTFKVHEQLGHVIASFAKRQEGVRAAERTAWSVNEYRTAAKCDLWVKEE